MRIGFAKSFFILLFFFCSFVVSKETDFSLQQYRYNFKNFKDRGIKYSTNNMIQDKKGVMWIGTQNGLIRFDGYLKTSFINDPADKTSLSSNYVESLGVDDAGYVWVGTRSGLNIVDTERNVIVRASDFNASLKPLEMATINTIHGDNRGSIWIGTNDGVFVYAPETGELSVIRARENDPLTVQENKIIGVSSATDIFILTEKSIYRVIGKGKMHKEVTLSELIGVSVTLQSFYVNNEKIYLGTTNRGLYVYDLKDKSILHSDVGPKDNDIRSIGEDENGIIWVASTNGVLLLEKDNSQSLHLTMKNHQYRGLDTNYFTSVYIDRENVTWLGSHDLGVYLFSPKSSTLITFPIEGELIQGGARTVAMSLDNKQNVWLAGKESLIKINLNDNKISAFNEPEQYKSASTYGITFDHVREKIYSATSDGIVNFDVKSEAFERFSPYPRYKGAYGIFIDSKDRMWVGGLSSEGISVFELATGKLLKEIPAQRTYSFLELDTHILAFTANGLFFVDKSNFELVIHRSDNEESLSHNAATGGLLDLKGRLWVATSGGLNLNIGDSIFENKYQHFTQADGFSSNVMTGPLEDNEGFLWVPTAKGLNRFSPESSEVISFGENEGAAETYFIAAYLKTKNGTLLFNSGHKGITIIEPGYSLPSKQIPLPFVSELHTDIDEISELRALSLSLASTNYYTANEMHYGYQLLGFDKDIIYIDSDRRHINYTNLPPGNYALNVVASRDGEEWSKPVHFEFKIEPKFYETLIFKFVLAAVMLFLVYLSYRLRVVVLKRRNMFLEQTIRERTKEIELQKIELEKMAVTDVLTGLGNRRYLELQIKTFWSQALRNFETDGKSGVAVFIIDIDHFKQVNEEIGHEAGDSILRQFSSLLLQSCRASDLLVRWGGEEFVIISPYSNVQGASELAKRIRETTRNHKFLYEKDSWINKTCSIGYYCYPGNQTNKNVSFDQALKIADSALYAMKEHCRDAWLGVEQVNLAVDGKLNTNFKDVHKLQFHSDLSCTSSVFF